MKKIISVVGARPNFMKVSPLYKELSKYNETIQHLICHTGQHYDEKMSKIFFDELGLPKPDFYLGVGSGSHAEQTSKVMIEFEKILLKEDPDLIIVVGDVNSTIACSLVATKLHIKVAHVEAGLRSFDRKMPEEINRICTDVISDFLFVSEKSGLINLKHEGIPASKTFFVGNVMIDNLINHLSRIDDSNILSSLNVYQNNYILVTFHRPSNVDSIEYLVDLIKLLNNLSKKRKIIFPLHPRTKMCLLKFHLLEKLNSNVIITEPLGYIEFIALVKNAELVITDSGGIQEETTYLQVQCITVRKNTERPITVEIGTNHLIGTDLNDVEDSANCILDGEIKKGKVPELWDGNTAKRVIDILIENI